MLGPALLRLVFWPKFQPRRWFRQTGNISETPFLGAQNRTVVPDRKTRSEKPLSKKKKKKKKKTQFVSTWFNDRSFSKPRRLQQPFANHGLERSDDTTDQEVSENVSPKFVCGCCFGNCEQASVVSNRLRFVQDTVLSDKHTTAWIS